MNETPDCFRCAGSFSSLYAAPLTAQHTVGDLLAVPAFAPFAERLLPWDGRPADKTLPLSQLGRLMPYHSAVNTADILGALNSLQQHAAQGQTVFYELYSPQERAADPAKAHTGLFFYPGKTGAPFALIAPGHGFALGSGTSAAGWEQAAIRFWQKHRSAAS